MMMRQWLSHNKRIMNNSYELWLALKKQGLLTETSPPYWWPNVKTFDVVVGAILTQQTKWDKVKLSLQNLQDSNLLSLEKLSQTPLMTLEELIRPSGFYKKKAKVLHTLTRAIVEEFGDFEHFQNSVTREWLLAQKGIGFESADAILCYACGRDVMVVDNYTNKLMKAFGYEFDSYDALQEWMMHGIEENYNEICKYYHDGVSFFTIYSRFHGKIVEYMKRYSHSEAVMIQNLENNSF